MAALSTIRCSFMKKNFHNKSTALISIEQHSLQLSIFNQTTFKNSDGRHWSLCKGRDQESESLPAQLIEELKFVPLTEDDPSFGPPVMLLIGFNSTEFEMVISMVDNMEGDFLKIRRCTEESLRKTLLEAVMSAASSLNDNGSALNQFPRICFFSGLTGEEILELIDAWPHAGLPETVFAAMVPNNADKPMLDLIEEVMGDHTRLTQ